MVILHRIHEPCLHLLLLMLSSMFDVIGIFLIVVNTDTDKFLVCSVSDIIFILVECCDKLTSFFMIFSVLKHLKSPSCELWSQVSYFPLAEEFNSYSCQFSSAPACFWYRSYWCIGHRYSWAWHALCSSHSLIFTVRCGAVSLAMLAYGQADILTAIGETCRELTSIDVRRNENMTDVGISSLTEGCSQLRTIRRWWCGCFVDYFVMFIAVIIFGGLNEQRLFSLSCLVLYWWLIVATSIV